MVIDIRRSAPLIAFPSWHVILAVISAYTLGNFRYLALPAAGWAILVVLSTLSTGWHYAVDVIAGVLVAGAALACANIILHFSRYELALI